MFFCIIQRIKAIKIFWLPILALYSCILPEDNLGTDTSFKSPTAIAQNGNMLYVLTGGADTQIRTINTATKEVRTVLKTSGTGRNDGRGTTARFNHPSDITFAWKSRTGRFRGWETLYVADTGNHFIREVQIEGTNMADYPNVLRMVGSSGAKGGYNDGYKLKSRFDSPQGIAASPDGKMLYVADTENHSIRTVARKTIMDMTASPPRLVKRGRQVDTLAGGRTPGEHGKGIAGYMDAVGADARFNGPTRVAVSPDGKTLYVADTGNNRIRSIEIASGKVETLAGDGSTAQFNQPQGIAVSGNTLYVCDTGNNRIRSIESGKVSTLAGDGTAAQFNQPQGIAVIGNTLYVADTGNNRIRSIEIASGKVETLAGDGT